MKYTGQHGHLSGGLHPAHAHMHGGWYASGMAGLGASGGLQGGFSSGGLSSGVVPHSQSYHLGISSMVSEKLQCYLKQLKRRTKMHRFGSKRNLNCFHNLLMFTLNCKIFTTLIANMNIFLLSGRIMAT